LCIAKLRLSSLGLAPSTPFALVVITIFVPYIAFMENGDHVEVWGRGLL
jgi:hypothetical protein